MAAEKFALCVETKDLPDLSETAFFYMNSELGTAIKNAPVQMVDRAICETDESLRQIIPYMVLHNTANGTLFVYARGGKSGEGRLVGNLSIGLGGHIDYLPAANQDLLQHCVVEGRRELEEEVGVSASAPDVHCVPVAYINNPHDAVGRVHLGVLFEVLGASELIGEHETSVIESGRWLTLEELYEDDTYNALEPWSKTALHVIKTLLQGEPK